MTEAEINNKVVTLKNVTLVGPGGPLFEPLTFDLKRGETLCLEGPNGAGKSLILKSIALGFPPKPFFLSGTLSAPYCHSKESYYLPQLQSPEVHMPYLLREIANFDAEEKISFPWFNDQIAQRPWNLASGGERMRALLARALASEAKLLILDEPFNHLDQVTAEMIRDTFLSQAKGKHKRSFLIVSHAENKAETNDADIQRFPTLHLNPVNPQSLGRENNF